MKSIMRVLAVFLALLGLIIPPSTLLADENGGGYYGLGSSEKRGPGGGHGRGTGSNGGQGNRTPRFNGNQGGGGSYNGPQFSRTHHQPVPIFQYHNRFNDSRNYFRIVPNRFIYRNTWIRWYVPGLYGYTLYGGYPYYAYNGYLYRYSYLDTCTYYLVDDSYNYVVDTFSYYACNLGYDMCAEARDDLNASVGYYRYFCSERYQ